MHIGHKIKYLVEQSETPNKRIAYALGYKSAQSLYDIYERENITTDILKKVCGYFKLPVTYFFDEADKGNLIEDPKIEYRKKNNEDREKSLLYDKIKLLEENKALLEEKIKKCLSEIDGLRTKQPV
jgi:hypothetical protein